MKLLIYFFNTVAILGIITFTYDLVKLGAFNWSSFAIIFCMIGVATGLKKNKHIQINVPK